MDHVVQTERSWTGPYIIGIGSSAGGLEAVRSLLGAAPQDLNAAWIVVQHMSPAHKSMLTQLIARETHLNVVQLDEPVTPKAGTAYTVPPKNDVVFRNGQLMLVAPSDQLAVPKPSVDRFFRSIAEEVGSHAVGIVLSGTGSDGSIGVQSIREVAGLTIAQDDSTAKYDGMPNSAIETGCVDLILTPLEIGDRLKNLSEAGIARMKDPDTEPDHPPLTEIMQLLLARKRVDFRDYKPSTVMRRLERRMAALSLTTHEEYASYCRKNPAEVDRLYRDLLISVTRFFRDPEDFLGLKPLIADLVSQNRSGPVRIWSAGCATGEEAYSIAILVAEAMGGLDNVEPGIVQIFASDIDEDALKRARIGRYAIGALSDVPADLLEKYFIVSDSVVEVRPDLKRMIVFSLHNVVQDPPFINIDLICCRNLLIYFGPVLQNRAFSHFHYALRAGGLLFLGTAENVSMSTNLFQPSRFIGNIFDRADVVNPDNASSARVMQYGRPQPTRIHPEKVEPLTMRPDASVNGLVKALVASQNVPALLMTADLEIISVFDDVSPYVKLRNLGGVPKLDHTLLVDPFNGDLRVLAAMALRKSKPQTGAPQDVEGVDFQVQMGVTALTGKDLPEDLLLVTFSPASDANDTWTSNSDPVPYAAELGRELATTKEALHTAIEEWETANEELKSMNEELQSNLEELQSTNEELETSNEELQSTNEELVTVNEAAQIANDEGKRMQGDLEAILREVGLPLMIVTPDLTISRASTAAIEQLGITADGEMHISQVALPSGVPPLAPIVDRVIRLGMQETVKTTHDDDVIEVLCRPYSTQDGRIEGATLIMHRNTPLPSGIDEPATD